MNRTRRPLTGVFALCLLLAGAFGGAGLWLQAQQHQFALNRQLIAALKRFDIARALAFVNAGANPNTRTVQAPTPSPVELLRQLLHRAPMPHNNSATALAVACGGFWENWEYGSFLEDPPGHDDTALVQAMLTHGADVNAKQEGDWTPLIAATASVRPATVRLLLEHGAHVNAYDATGRTALVWGVSRIDTPAKMLILNLLLDHGANTNVEDDSGDTGLMSAIGTNETEVVRLLLNHGANPNRVDRHGQTLLPFAQALHNPDIIALLKHAGAKDSAERP